jgi:hypothetical protein
MARPGISGIEEHRAAWMLSEKVACRSELDTDGIS